MTSLNALLKKRASEASCTGTRYKMDTRKPQRRSKKDQIKLHLPKIMDLHHGSFPDAIRQGEAPLLPRFRSQDIPTVIHHIVTVLATEPDGDGDLPAPNQLVALVRRAEWQPLLHVPGPEHRLGAADEEALPPLGVVRQSEDQGDRAQGLDPGEESRVEHGLRNWIG